MPSANPLLKPLTIGNLTLRNRIVMSALTRNRSVPTNVPNHVNQEYYQQRAKGGAGLIISEGALIDQQGTEWPHAPGIWSKEQIAAWKKVTDAVHAENGLIFAQLWHVGRMAHSEAPEQLASGKPIYAPSAIAARAGKFRFLEGAPSATVPNEVPNPAILVEQFRQAGLNAKEAGFDGVEVHGANGYLISQFFDSGSNKRTDAYGGTPEKRTKFALDVLKALTDVWGPHRVGIRINPAGGYNDVGMPLDETVATFGHFLSQADQFNLAYITFIRYLPFFDIEIDGKKRATPHDVLATFRPFIKNTPVLINGNVLLTSGSADKDSVNVDTANKLVEEGTIDGVVIGRPWISHPDLVKRFEQGKPMDQAVDFMTLNGPGADPSIDVEAQRKGYTDYPFATA